MTCIEYVCVDFRLITCQDWVTEIHSGINFNTGKNWLQFWVAVCFVLLECNQCSKEDDTKTWFTDMSYLMEVCCILCWSIPFSTEQHWFYFLGLSKTGHTSFLTGWDMHARTCVLWMWHVSLLFYMLLCSHHRWSLNIFARMSVDIFGKVKHSGLNKTLGSQMESLKTFCCLHLNFHPWAVVFQNLLSLAPVDKAVHSCVIFCDASFFSPDW